MRGWCGNACAPRLPYDHMIAASGTAKCCHRRHGVDRGGTMTITRRSLMLGSAGVLGLAPGLAALARPAFAQGAGDPIRIGWLAALTGASSAPGVGFNRGVLFAADEINAA